MKSLTDMLFPLAMTDSKHDAAALLVDIIGDFQESATLLDNALQAVGLTSSASPKLIVIGW